MAGDCGTCTACCKVFAIPEIEKPAGDWCKHCAVGSGCKIYEARPPMCRQFECLWLLTQKQPNPMGPALRPDRSKVVISPTTNDNVMSVITMPGSPFAWKKPGIRLLIDMMVADGMSVAIGPPMSTRKTLIGQFGEKEVRMTDPDENGMQWSIPSDN